MTSKLVASHKKDLEMFRSFEKGGWLQSEVDIMRKEKAKFGVANIASFDIRCLRQYTEVALLEHCPQRNKVPKQSAAALSAAALAFAAADSQPVTAASADPSQQLAAPTQSSAAETISAEAVLAELDELDIATIF